MGSPYFDFEAEENPQSRFLDLYSRLASSPGTDFSQFLDPNDPELLAYRKRATEPTGSEGLISEYIGRRPNYEDYKPGLGRKLAAFAMGALSGSPGGAYGLAQKHLYAPYEQAESDWKNEGQGISSRARLMDAERQRELAGMKYGLTQKASGLRAKATDEGKRRDDARLLAQGVQSEERARDANQDRDDRLGLSKQIFEFRQNQEKYDREQNIERDTERKERQTKADLDRSILDDARRKRMAGLDIEFEDDVTEIVYRNAARHPIFKDLISKDPESGSWQETDPGSERTRLLRIWMDNEMKKIRKEMLGK